jgi:hypothetical protein
MDSRDRRAAILASTLFNGVDFVEIANTAQTVLRVHFLNAVAIGSLDAAPTITGGETIPTVATHPVQPADWGWDDGHVVLTLRVDAPGDFSNYTLTLANKNKIDAFFGSVVFSFKAGCPADVDCAPTPATALPAPSTGPTIDYLAKDFSSFRQALLDFSTQSYPNWQERSEADFGIMFLEALSAVGDELSYLQDRVAAEQTLLTATQRRSATRHARLVDYEPRPAVSATTILQFDVDASAPATMPVGLQVFAPGADGVPIYFETGLGLNDASAQPPLDPRWNSDASIAGYWFDESVRRLPVGATSMYLQGHGYGFQPGQALLIETAPSADSLDPPQLQIVHLLPAGDPSGPWALESQDEIFNRPVTLIAWIVSDALTAARDLASTTVIGNIVAATQGRTLQESFMIGPSTSTAPNAPPLALERLGALAAENSSGRPAVRMRTLAAAPVTWLPQPDSPGSFQPEIDVNAASSAAGDPDAGPWSWAQSLLQAGAFLNVFTLDSASYNPLGVNSDGSTTYEYDGDSGDTIRFGDGRFGASPSPGTTFTIRYRVGAGAAGNVASGAISRIDASTASKNGLKTVSNPFAAAGGQDRETLLSIQRNAPQQFRSVMLRAVLPADYSAAAQTQPWVKRASTSRRWTGSWLTTFTTPEPVASETILTTDRIGLIDLLNRYRMAGTEVYVPDPDYVSIDLAIDICAQTSAFAAQVRQDVSTALAPAGGKGSGAFFAVSTFGFGQPLYRAALEMAIQAVPGVDGVTSIRFRLSDHSLDFAEMGDSVTVGANQILRCDNDPSLPNSGALSISVGGGR